MLAGASALWRPRGSARRNFAFGGDRGTFTGHFHRRTNVAKRGRRHEIAPAGGITRGVGGGGERGGRRRRRRRA